MKPLRELLTDSGFYKVETLLQSGNIIFCTEEYKQSELEYRIHDLLLEHFEIDTEVFCFKRSELKNIFKSNPFLKHPDFDYKKMYYTFGKTVFGEKEFNSFLELSGGSTELFSALDQSLFCYYENGYGKVKLSNNQIEKYFKTICTTRNYNTLSKLIS